MDGFIREMIARAEGNKPPEAFKSRQDAADAVKAFYEMPRPEIKVGDLIERNEAGKVRYKIPHETQAAICVAKFDEPRFDSEEDYYDMIMLVALSKGMIRHYKIDSRYYQVAAERKNVFKLFNRE